MPIMRWNILEKMVKSRGWTTGAELGVWRGMTYKHLVQTCPKLSLFGVDLYEAQPDNDGPEKWTPGENGHAWDHESYYKGILAFMKKYPDRATFYKGTTTEAATQIEDGSLDFVFIDADHSYEGVKEDIKNWVPKLKSGGCLIGHDIDWPDVKKAVEEFSTEYDEPGDNMWLIQM